MVPDSFCWMSAFQIINIILSFVHNSLRDENHIFMMKVFLHFQIWRRTISFELCIWWCFWYFMQSKELQELIQGKKLILFMPSVRNCNPCTIAFHAVISSIHSASNSGRVEEEVSLVLLLHYIAVGLRLRLRLCAQISLLSSSHQQQCTYTPTHH